MKKILLVSSVLAVGLLPLSAIAYVIDGFETSSTPISVYAPPNIPPAVGQVSFQQELDANVIGGKRSVQVARTAGAEAVRGYISGGGLNFASGPSVSGNMYMYYYGPSDSGFPRVDLTVGGTQTGVIMQFTFSDHPSSVSMTAISLQGSGTGTEVGFPYPNQVYFAFTDFPAVNWTNIVALSFEIDSGLANDYTLQFIETRVGPPVPDTGGTLALLSIAFGLLGVARLKMKS